MTKYVLFVVLAALKLVAMLRYRVNLDEPQHLHVAWGWSRGLISYRDVFDNHTPLLHMLSAPLVALLGERADIVLWMRAPMLLLWLASMIAAFCIARRLYSTRAAWWTVIVVSAYPPFFLKTLEYRTDNLWTALWMLAIALLVVGTSTLSRIAAGFLLGCAICTSMKTLVLVLALAIATIVVHFLFDRDGFAALLRRAAAPAIAFAIPPLLVGAFFYLHDAWKAMVYCVVTFNLIAAKPRAAQGLYPLFMLLMIALAALIAKRKVVERDAMWLALIVVTYFATTQAFWPILSQRDYLAVMPLMAMFLVAMIPPRAAAALSVVFLLSLFHYTEGFRDRAREHVAMMQQVLALTRAGDCVIDAKGETIYRSRPFYYALETIARGAMSKQLIADTIPESVIAHRCHVAGADLLFFPPRSRAFLTANFLDSGMLRVAGRRIGSDGSFSVAIPGRYVIASRDGLARGMLDGVPHRGAVLLNAGTHRFLRTARDEPVVFLWAEAFERGYSPFRRRQD